MYPFIYLLNASANMVLGLAGLSGKGGHDSHYSVEELKLILRTSQPGEKFNQDERNILAHSLDFSDLSVSDLMRPINEVISLHAAAPAQRQPGHHAAQPLQPLPVLRQGWRDRAGRGAPERFVLRHAVRQTRSPT
jgi:CBS domain containing-hemolysin-like protein